MTPCVPSRKTTSRSRACCPKTTPALFNTNALLVTSDGIAARVGSLSADLERFMPWRTTDGATVALRGAPELSTLIDGMFEQRRLLLLLRDFTVW